MSRHVALSLVLLFALGLFALPAFTEDDPAPAPKPSEGEKAGEPKEEGDAADVPAATSIPVVKLLEAGAEPRRQLRYAPSADSKVEFSSSITSDIESTMGAMKIGPIKMDYLVALTKGDKDGELMLAIEITNAKMEDDGSMPWAGSMKGDIESAKGEKLQRAISTRGIWLDDSAESQSAQQEMRAQVLNMMPPLPEEAVGVGAKWTVTVKISSSGVTQTSVSTVELTKCDGSRIEVAIGEARSAKDASMSMQGMEVKIPELSGTGEGTAIVDLALGGTVSSSSTVDVEMTMDMMGQQMNNKRKVTSTLSGAAPTAVATEEK
jgi:hypothetical protein